ncbi:MAG: dihydrolipoyl dehydrogenase [Clostridiales bacterium]|nr:dihydrolipoyl dehydrogenase [Clostridiales bacterium]
MGKKIIIVGGGPAGYVSAIRGAQLGAEVHLIEKSSLGGTCLNVGCIPTKVLLHASDFYHKARTAAVPGVNTTAELDWPAVLAHKEQVVNRLTGGVSWLLEKAKVQVHSGFARVLPGLRVQVGGDTLSADAIILATGSANTAIPFHGSDLEGILDSTAALALRELPKSVAIIGGGVIGVEFATLFTQLGVETTVVEMQPEVLPTVDGEIAALLRQKLTGDGVRIYTSASLTGVEKGEGKLSVQLDQGGQGLSIQAEKVLVAVGRRPNTAGMGLEELGVAMDRGAILVDAHYQTSIAGLYAVGDCNAKLMLAHAAMEQGLAAIGHSMGLHAEGRQSPIPSCVYTSPEIASVGLTEEQVKEKGLPYTTGRFPLGGNGKAIIEGEDGLIKILTDKEYGEILGVHMIGPKVTEMIAEAALCMDMEGTVDDLIHAVHAHPTVSEALGEAAMAVLGKGIHS